MYILSRVNYSDRSSSLEIYKYFRWMVEDVCEQLDLDYESFEQREKACQFIKDYTNEGKFVHNEQEWEIIEV